MARLSNIRGRLAAFAATLAILAPVAGVAGVNGPAAMQTNAANAALPAAQINLGVPPYRNLLFNGAMGIDQRHEGASVSAGTTCCANTFLLDGWFSEAQTGATISAQQVADAPPGFTNSLKALVNTGDATVTSSDFWVILAAVRFEDMPALQYGTANAKTSAMSVWAKCSQSANLTVTVQTPLSTRVFNHNIAATTSWQEFVYTIPGDTLVSSTNWAKAFGDVGAYFAVTLSGGSGATTQPSYDVWANVVGNGLGSLQTNLATTTGAYCEFDAKWEASPVATAFLPPDPATEMVRALQQYHKTFPPGVMPAQNAGVAGAVCVAAPVANSFVSAWVPAGIPTLVDATGATEIFTYNPSAANANWRDVTAGADVAATVDPAGAIGTTGGLSGVEIKSGNVATQGDDLCIHVVLESRWS